MACGIAVLLLFLGLGSVALYAAPFIPSSDEQVLERLRAPSDPQMRELSRLRRTLAQEPHNLALALDLARQYSELGRAEADPRYDGYAEAALQPWWNMPEPPLAVLILRATLRQRRHNFDDALADLAQVIARQPNNPQAWLSRAVILQVRGDHEAARRSCLPLLRRASALIATTCIASAASLSGQAKDSYQMLRKVLEGRPSSTAQERLWALTVLAEIATRLGYARAAEAHFKEALSLGLRDTYLLGAFADFLLDEGRAKEVEALLKTDTQPDGLLLRLALAERQLASPQLPSHVQNLSARFAANRMRGERLHLRDEARFTLYLLAKPDEALQLAKRNWAVQKEPWDARVLLEAALQAHDPLAARPVLDWLQATRLEDKRLQDLAAAFQ
jgi:tetratricopeptide (TPR) repeat protein